MAMSLSINDYANVVNRFAFQKENNNASTGVYCQEDLWPS